MVYLLPVSVALALLTDKAAALVSNATASAFIITSPYRLPSPDKSLRLASFQSSHALFASISRPLSRSTIDDPAPGHRTDMQKNGRPAAILKIRDFQRLMVQP